jgi:integrase
MGRLVRDARLETREARRRLPARKEPHWRLIEEGVHLGYYKGNVGKWYVRVRPANGTNYRWKAIAQSDDSSEANGITILNYSQAQDQARAIAETLILGDDHERNAKYTVNNAAEDYLADFKTHGKKSYYATEKQINSQILPILGNKLVSELTYRELDSWKNNLAKSSKRIRSSKIKKKKKEPTQKFKADDGSDPEYQRKRRATTNRILTILKAILNYAYRTERVATNTAWIKLKPFKNVTAAKIQFLNENEVIRLLNHCEPDFRYLVRAALLTGARYGELTSLKVSDLHNNVISIYQSKSGKPRHVPLNAEGIKFFSMATAGKLPDEFIFTNAAGKRWGKAHQSRPFAKACLSAKLAPGISFHHLRHTYASTLAMKGVPLQVIADLLGHSDTRITHKHYAHLLPSYLADVVNMHLPDFGKTEDSNLIPIKKAACE